MAKYWYSKYEIAWDFDGLIRDNYLQNVGGYLTRSYGWILNKITLEEIYVKGTLDRTGPDLPEIYGYNKDHYALRNNVIRTLPRESLEYLKEYRTNGVFIENFVAEEGTYPDDGIHSDEFWYVKGDKAIPTIKIADKTVGAIKFRDSTGAIKNIANITYKDSTGSIRQFK